MERRRLLRWHALLSPGRGLTAELRGWDRLLRLREPESTVRRLRVLADYAVAPITSAQHAWNAVRRHGAAVAERYGVSRTRQFLDQWWLGARHGITPDSYYLYRLHLPDRRPRADQYVQVSELDRLLHLLVVRTSGDPTRILADKSRFYDWCAHNELAYAESLVEVSPDGAVRVSTGHGELPPVDLFSKVTTLRSAQGARAWRRLDDGRWDDGSGQPLDAAELIEALHADARALGRPIVVQRRLSNHPALLHLTNGALSTIRVATIREPGGEPFVLSAGYRMGVGAAIADNLSQGGMAAPVDVATGELGCAVRMNPPLYDECDEHPTTGRRISGTIVPFWDDVVSLTVRAHSALPRMAFVGWDVAVLADGPVLVEGNRFPSARLSQVASGIPLGETRFLPLFDRHLRASFGLADIPQPRPADVRTITTHDGRPAESH